MATPWRLLVAAVAAAALLGAATAEEEEEVPSFYHSSAQIAAAARDMASHCAGASVEEVRDEQDADTHLDVVTLLPPGATSASDVEHRSFFLFGEHARELISPETGLRFLRHLCESSDDDDSSSFRGRDSLFASERKDTAFRLVLNANARSRMKVEAGDSCLRVNENGVDLNRNWGDKWAPDNDANVGGDTYPGSAPFSEPQTRILKATVTDFAPTLFLTVHSGTRGMYMSWAFDMEHQAERNRAPMLELLHDLDARYCKCPFGAAGEQVGYSCPGTCLDYVYDKLKCDFSYAFEIFTHEAADASLEAQWEELSDEYERGMSSAAAHVSAEGKQQLAAQFLELHVASDHFHGAHTDSDAQSPAARAHALVQASQQQSFLRAKLRGHHHRSRGWPHECFDQFNPRDQEVYESVAENWSAAFIKLSAAAKVKKANR